MKISFNTSDIKGMVMECVKKCLFEGMDIRSLIENLPISQALDPYREVFGEDAFNALSSSRGDIFDVMQQTFDNGTPEQQQEYVARVKGEFQGEDGIDIELDPDVMAMISEAIDRALYEQLEEVDISTPEKHFSGSAIMLAQKISSDYERLFFEVKKWMEEQPTNQRVRKIFNELSRGRNGLSELLLTNSGKEGSGFGSDGVRSF